MTLVTGTSRETQARLCMCVCIMHVGCAFVQLLTTTKPGTTIDDPSHSMLLDPSHWSSKGKRRVVGICYKKL